MAHAVCPNRALVTSALDKAIRNRAAQPGVVMRSNHGVQYTSWAFTDRARASGLLPSMGFIGDCYDNVMIESCWGRVQNELLNGQRWRTHLELANALFDYLEIFHNRRRRCPFRDASDLQRCAVEDSSWTLREPVTCRNATAPVNGHRRRRSALGMLTPIGYELRISAAEPVA